MILSTDKEDSEVVNNICYLGPVVKDSAAKKFHGLALDRTAVKTLEKVFRCCVAYRGQNHIDDVFL